MLVSTQVVVRNQEGQYSIWARDRPIPVGWESQGVVGSKEECLRFIRDHWVDIGRRPAAAAPLTS